MVTSPNKRFSDSALDGEGLLGDVLAGLGLTIAAIGL